jgi:hypothetical protein
MITLKIIMTRPTHEVEFFPETSEYKSTLEEFKSSGKIISEKITLSDDLSTRIREITFSDDEDHIFWRHHPNIVAWINQRKKHDAENHIMTDIEFV